MKKDKLVPNDTHGNGSLGKATTATPKRGKQDVNLRKRGFLRFQVGLIIALLLVYFGLEASFRIQQEIIEEYEPPLEHTTLIPADIPIVLVEEETKPVLEKKSTVTFTPVDDEVEIEIGKEIFTDNETSPASVNVDSIAYYDPVKEETATVIIDLVEEVPIFPGCEDVKKEERLACFNEKMKKHVKRVFRYPEAAKAMEMEGRVNVMFKIGADGSVEDIQMRGPDDILEKEAARIIGKLPKMVPGKMGGKPVKVPYSIPIFFQLN